MINLEAKRILFICPIFHDYHLLIIKELTKLGALVDFFPERDYSFKYKITNVFFKSRLKKKQEKYYLGIWERISNNEYDYLYVIRGSLLTFEFLNLFSNKNPTAFKIMYQWDSEKMNPFVHLQDSFDVIYSFDFKDCSDYKTLIYLPLFYTKDIKEENSKNEMYDLFFMGWYLPERYSALIKMKNDVKGTSLRMKNFIYLPFTSFVKELFKGHFFWDNEVISFNPMTRKDYIHYLNHSRAIVDVSNKLQTGLAIRIMEAFALKKKIITNNIYIKNVPNITGKQVLILDEKTDALSILNFLNENIDAYYLPLSITDWLIKQFEHK